MKLRQVAVLALVALAAGACKKKTPPATPAPVADDSAAIRQARADSIAAAERAAREAADRAARERAAAVARVREDLANVVYFEYDSEQLTEEAQTRLRTKAEILRSNPSLMIRVEGHADQRGSTEYNLALGQRRAESVRDFIMQYGIPADRIETLSYGEERPAVEGDDEGSMARNRRAEFVITGGEVTNIPTGGF